MNNTYTLRNIFREYTKQDKSCTEQQYSAIVRGINKILITAALAGDSIILPCNMGRIELRKSSPSTKIVDGKVVTFKPVDWQRTKKLWEEYPECKQSKQLVRFENEFVFSLQYKIANANYKNKRYYTYEVPRSVKHRIANLAKNGKLDAPLLKDLTYDRQSYKIYRRRYPNVKTI